MATKVSDSATRLAELIRYYNISQQEFCDAVGLSKSTVSLYLSNKREPKQSKLAQISEHYDIDPAWLMGYDVPMNKLKDKFNKDTALKDVKLLEAYHKLTPDKQELAYQMILSMQ